MSESEAAQENWRGSPVGDYMKSTSGWNDYNESSGNGSNSSGFDSRPGGNADSWGFYGNGDSGYWWSSSASGSSSAWVRSLRNVGTHVYRYDYNRGFGFSARCVRD